MSARTTGSVNSLYVGVDRGRHPCRWLMPQPTRTSRPSCRRFSHRSPPPLRLCVTALVHTYRIHLDWENQRSDRSSHVLPDNGAMGKGPWRRIGFVRGARACPHRHLVRDASSRRPPHADRVTETMLEPPQLKSDFALFRKALEEAHPALYRHTTKREMDAEFAKAEAKLTRPMTLLEFRNVLGLVLAAIKDLDT